MRKPANTRQRIIDAAAKLYYTEGIGRVSVDAVAALAGVTKRTLYYHFESKEQLVVAYLEGRDQPNLVLMARWFAEANGDVQDRVAEIFLRLAVAARHPKWKGCAFLRTIAELAGTPRHPAVLAAVRHKAAFESWLAEEFGARGIPDPKALAREIQLLLDGAFSATLVHRDAAYFLAAAEAARELTVRRMRR